MATAATSARITSDHKPQSAVQRRSQPSMRKQQPPITTTTPSPSLLKILSLISQSLLHDSNHQKYLNLLRQSISETRKFLERARQELEISEEDEDVRGLDGSSLMRSFAFWRQVLGNNGDEKERVRLIRGLVEGLEREVLRGEREVGRLEGKNRRREGDVVEGESEERFVEENGGVLVTPLDGEVAANMTDAATAKDEISKDFLKDKDEYTARHPSRRSRKSSAKVPEKEKEKEKDALSDIYGLSSRNPSVCEAGAIGSASSYTRVTRAPTVASSRSMSIAYDSGFYSLEAEDVRQLC
ncbi:uncharacterized protein MYCFIDRAFT_78616 [Pseudocercospora fijiensis CIRAD86]|uniref:Uncharacterized protein n=1 Tax=Pseudocercospora fijiensis (strain CIRAD86) TaxID=383855 RepID=N1QCP0_PSEFD|nr:uncharacterized protein MYCFIDRAFT_78616 [Pseudocercospora fijiensis CIRAD86]EME89587.1 hypothetical protein MYCFIDRAFT_78616 [Pseudocercospora fijiensis CIRAD86]